MGITDPKKMENYNVIPIENVILSLNIQYSCTTIALFYASGSFLLSLYSKGRQYYIYSMILLFFF
jgi:hypothetical protein